MAHVSNTNRRRTLERFRSISLAQMRAPIVYLSSVYPCLDVPVVIFLVVRSISSGPMRFEYHEEVKRWLNTRDGETELRVILATEMSEKCGVSV